MQEVVLLADFGCKGCQEKVATMMSRMNGELFFPVMFLKFSVSMARNKKLTAYLILGLCLKILRATPRGSLNKLLSLKFRSKSKFSAPMGS